MGEPQGTGRLSFGASAPTQDVLQAGGAELTRCHYEYFHEIAGAWGMEAGYNRVLGVLADLNACLAEKGVELPPDAIWQDMQAATKDAPHLLSQCSVQVNEQH